MLLLGRVSSGHAQEYMVWGVGSKSCGEWTAAHGSRYDAGTLVQDAWLGGYMTGFDYYGLRSGTPKTDFAGMAAWVTSYCQGHPLDDIVTAATGLANELLERQR